MTVPWAVEPDERRLPVAQVKPEPAKVRPAAAAPLEAGADPEAGALAAAEEAGADEAPLAAADDAGAAAALGAAELDEVLEAGVLLLSLPQALRVSAPTAKRATKALVRVICTPFLQMMFAC